MKPTMDDVTQPAAECGMVGHVGLGKALAVFCAYLLVSSYNQLLLLPFERAATPALRAAPVLVVAIPVLLVAIFHVGVLITIAVAISAWTRYRTRDHCIATLRTSTALAG